MLGENREADDAVKRIVSGAANHEVKKQDTQPAPAFSAPPAAASAASVGVNNKGGQPPPQPPTAPTGPAPSAAPAPPASAPAFTFGGGGEHSLQDPSLLNPLPVSHPSPSPLGPSAAPVPAPAAPPPMTFGASAMSAPPAPRTRSSTQRRSTRRGKKK